MGNTCEQKVYSLQSSLTPFAEPRPITCCFSAVAANHNNSTNITFNPWLRQLIFLGSDCCSISLHRYIQRIVESRLTKSKGHSRKGWQFPQRWLFSCRSPSQSWRETHTRLCSHHLAPQLNRKKAQTEMDEVQMKYWKELGRRWEMRRGCVCVLAQSY